MINAVLREEYIKKSLSTEAYQIIRAHPNFVKSAWIKEEKKNV